MERDGSVGVGDLMARENNERRRLFAFGLFASLNRLRTLTGWRFFSFHFFLLLHVTKVVIDRSYHAHYPKLVGQKTFFLRIYRFISM
jgi:hypothetical protein